MYSLKQNRLPLWHLKMHKYKIKSDNEFVREYRKTIITKDYNNCAMMYYIHIFYHKKEDWSDVCVSTQQYSFEKSEWLYDWYSGSYSDKSLPIIKKYDRKLLKYLEELEE